MAAWSKMVENFSDGTTPQDIATKAVKYDTGKPRMELLPPAVLLEVAKVLTYGAQKYDEHNWRKGFRWTRPMGAALRHEMAWLSGHDWEEQPNGILLHHVAQAICELMFVLDSQLQQLGTDDRWRKE